MPAAAAAAAEASRLLDLADSELAAGRLRAAQKHARRAARLHPGSRRADLLLTATSVLLADASSHTATLLLPGSPASPPLSRTALRRQYKSLSKSLRPDPASSSPAASAAAGEALARAADAYVALTTALAAVPVPPLTFWTACSDCRLLHEFDRQYVGFRLVCPSCRRRFIASEVPPPSESDNPSPPRKKPKTEEPEMTLAEMQLQLQLQLQVAKKRAKDEEGGNNHHEMMAVVDSDFYDFDADRGERCFKRGQVWALYGDDDGMPRHYALVEAVSPGSRFCLQIRWLDLQSDGEEAKPCGEFKVGRADTVDSVNVFSHLVAYERVAREAYRIHPRKGSVWALHGEKDGESSRPTYEFVVFLSGYSELYGASFGYLEKVKGFRSVFIRRDVGSHAVQTLQKSEIGVLSHQIPARKMSKGEGSMLPPGDYWELDPASLPSELLLIEQPIGLIGDHVESN